MTRVIFINNKFGKRIEQRLPAWKIFNLLKRDRSVRSMTIVDGNGETTFTKSKSGKVKVYHRDVA
jgi:hypothetical protein